MLDAKMSEIKPPVVLIVCHVAVVDEVAIKDWLALGAVALPTLIVVVADNKLFADIVFVELFSVLFVNVWVSVVPITDPVNPCTPDEAPICVSIWACVCVPMFA